MYIIKSTHLLESATQLLCINVTNAIKSFQRVRVCSATLQGRGHVLPFQMQSQLQTAANGVGMSSVGLIVCYDINKNTALRQSTVGRRLMSYAHVWRDLNNSPILL